MSRCTRAIIRTSALKHNLDQVRQYAPGSRVWSVVKAGGYGHGATIVAQALIETDGFAVATLDEALALRQQGINHPILLLEGVTDSEHWLVAVTESLQCVVHCDEQIEQLKQVSLDSPLSVWIKIDTGMHRLGFAPERVGSIVSELQTLTNISVAGSLTHLASADEAPKDAVTQQQIKTFYDVAPADSLHSIANSAGIIRHMNSHADWIRPGIMLYGASPVAVQRAKDFGLRPVMTLEAPVIAIRVIAEGECVGYGHCWQAKQPSRIATLAIGYGDGYPRHAPDGTPVWLNGQCVPLVGRVSMDMLTVDVSGLDSVAVGDMAELWGENLSVDKVAEHIGTIGYELLTRVSTRVHFQISQT